MFLGTMCRTRYADHGTLAMIISLLHQFQPELVVIHGAKAPFDMFVQNTCDRLGVEAVSPVEDPIWAEQHGFDRDPIIVQQPDTAALIVYLPHVGKPEEMEDVHIVHEAMEQGLRIFLVHQGGEIGEFEYA